jgi:hypothetical protein
VREPTFIVFQNSVISIPHMSPQQLWDQITAVNGGLEFEHQVAMANKELRTGLLAK